MENENDSINNLELPPTNPTSVPYEPSRRSLILWIVALSILSFGGQIYSEITGDWFPTFITCIANDPPILWGVVSAFISILGVVFFLFFGAISDNLRSKHGRRIPMMIVGGIITAVLTATFVLSKSYIWIFLNYGILTAIFYNMVRGASAPLTPDLIPLEKRGRVNTLTTIMGNLASAVVWIPALVFLPGNATCYSAATVNIFVYIGAAVFGITIIIGGLMIKEPPVTEPRRNWIVDLKQTVNMQEMKKERIFLIFFWVNIFQQAAGAAIFNYLFLFIQKIDFVLTNDVFIEAGIVIIILVGGIIVLGKAIDSVGRKFVTIFGMICCPIGSFIIALSNGNLVMLMYGFAIFFPCYLGATNAIGSWTQDIIPKEFRGRFYGLLNITGAIGSALGSVFSAALVEYFSDNYFYIFVAAAILLWISLPSFYLIPETLIKKKKATMATAISDQVSETAPTLPAPLVHRFSDEEMDYRMRGLIAMILGICLLIAYFTLVSSVSSTYPNLQIYADLLIASGGACLLAGLLIQTGIIKQRTKKVSSPNLEN